MLAKVPELRAAMATLACCSTDDNPSAWVAIMQLVVDLLKIIFVRAMLLHPFWPAKNCAQIASANGHRKRSFSGIVALSM